MADHLDFLASFADFITASPSSYHAARVGADLLAEHDYTEVDETQPWDDVAGKRFLIRDGALVAWRTPVSVDANTGVRIVGSHTDSPALKLKPRPNHTSAGWAMANMEIYGGPLLNSWLDRELALAVRLVTVDGRQHLVRTPAMLRVAQLAPHLDRSVNEKLTLDKQANMLPFFAVGEGFELERYLCELAGIDRSELAHHDVVTIPTEAPAVFGTKQEFFAAARMDNLSSVFASLQALVDLDECGDIVLLVAFDHEEVGSSTRSGAAGPLLEDVLVRLAEGLGLTPGEYRALLARSSCISADAGHAVHPNYAQLHDPTNQPMINQGPLLKINANQRYATDGVGGAIWQRACAAADVPSQSFVSNNSVPCGSTIGPLTATRLGITTVDVGIPLLSMHSTRELCGSRDPLYLSQALGAYWAGA